MADRPYWDERDMVANNERPEILAIGDSWFWYPFNNLLNPIFNIWRGKVILAIGDNGAEAVEYVGARFQTLIAQTLEAYQDSIRMVLVSGGGNDIAGEDDFDLILKEDCSDAATVAECYEAAQPAAIMDTIESACRTLIVQARRVLPDAAIILHNYDYAIPSGLGFFGMGNWLRKPMDDARVKRELQAPLVNDLIDQLGLRLAQLEGEFASVRLINSAGTLAAGEWANELHPKPAGFNKIVRRCWRPVLRELLPA
jgi:hypothetical protein